MTQVHQIGYKTSLKDVIDMVREDFKVEIQEEMAKKIFLCNNRSELFWSDEEIIGCGFRITKDGVQTGR